ncbi:hypothetical protein WH50_09455 [Pokkaliibacter plantistimulans]|uniref:Cds6 C-terminal domain-containing protein n=1 Tax=Pokkaliibacter plantistimulans TaxID=1635171 RepID=A0ABX5LXZ1_9GAMM|nr:nuclear transport factor 2 family protein [Pokkaliibacter plantistimulans]PXF31522.1 hypothetical protein WH50_09455 [Pokkaliibacter plantistimulans]
MNNKRIALPALVILSSLGLAACAPSPTRVSKADVEPPPKVVNKSKPVGIPDVALQSAPDATPMPAPELSASTSTTSATPEATSADMSQAGSSSAEAAAASVMQNSIVANDSVAHNPNAAPVMTADMTSTAEAPADEANAAAPVVENNGMADASAAPASPAAADKPASPQAAIELSYQSLLKTVEGWRAAWSSQDVDSYLSFYSPDFAPDNMSRKSWEQQRRQKISAPKWIKVELGEPQVAIVDSRAIIRFEQSYSASGYQDKVVKELEMDKENGEWKIVKETSL